MFGYLQVQKCELLVREFEEYKSVYCGLCKQTGKNYSALARAFLSYDCTFYAMLLMSVNKSSIEYKNGRCTCNPLKKCKFANTNSDAYKKASAFSVISGYYKLKDDISDSKLPKSIVYRLILPFFSHWRKKALKEYPEIDKIASEMMKNQYEAENTTYSTIDNSAHPTATMLGELFKLEAKDNNEKLVFFEFGYHLGRWIYFVDAADDINKDIKNKCFNPFINLDNAVNHSPDEIGSILNQSLARAYDAYNLIDISEFKGILDNMMLKGFPAVQNKIIKKLSENN